MNNDLIIKASMVLQTILNKRFEHLKDNRQSLPFSDTKVVEFSHAASCLTKNTIFEFQDELRKILNNP